MISMIEEAAPARTTHNIFIGRPSTKCDKMYGDGESNGPIKRL